jgi:hypothetical protein
MWILKACAAKDGPQNCDWALLIKGANQIGKLPLDDIFPLVPKDMELDSLHGLVANAVERTSRGIQRSEKLRLAIERKAEEQRKIINSREIKPVELRPGEVKCFFCGQAACDAGFVVFPCGHVIHVACFLHGGAAGGDEQLEKLARSCPACGSAALVILDTPFVDPEHKWEVYERWRVPD